VANKNFPQQACFHQMRGAFNKGLLTKSLLLTGPKGIGKYMLAQHLAAHILNLTIPSEQSFKMLTTHPDFTELKPLDNATCISIDQIRELLHNIQQTTHSGNDRVVMVTPAEHLNATASNALLKTLEAPNSHTFFMLISHTPQRLLKTLKSRCHEIKLHVPPKQLSTTWLKQHIADAPQQTIDQLMYFSFDRPSLAMQIHLQQQLADYQAMHSKIIDILVHHAPLQAIIKDVKNQFDVFNNCLKRFIIDCIYQQNQAKPSLSAASLHQASKHHASINTLNACWQHIIALEASLIATPNINLELNLYVLLTKLLNTLNTET
jgi:replication-associated recombination protein RarA